MKTIEIFFSIMKKYKGILAIAFAATILVACNTLTTAEKAERDAKTAMAVEAALNDRHYTVEIEWMYPISGRARYVLSFPLLLSLSQPSRCLSATSASCRQR